MHVLRLFVQLRFEDVTLLHLLADTHATLLKLLHKIRQRLLVQLGSFLALMTRARKVRRKSRGPLLLFAHCNS